MLLQVLVLVDPFPFEILSNVRCQPLHPEDRAEICHDIVFRGIRATSMERTFQQLGSTMNGGTVMDPRSHIHHWTSISWVVVSTLRWYVFRMLSIRLSNADMDSTLHMVSTIENVL